ncbi:MAG: hypothetical protein A3E79_03330 [Burkholderiales bacterium RIFCSPHIGHO2_12_FULL_61_11]|nr:MAG: hypothetical protein A3E79_03330 [Burkholderiales bacterium RIFCSPHIGHO2_12_FULL_61_11]
MQYVVITSGAQRVSEVAARFTLDSMPGQQMSIDADLNMGFIDQVEAQRRRKNIEKGFSVNFAVIFCSLRDNPVFQNYQEQYERHRTV